MIFELSNGVSFHFSKFVFPLFICVTPHLATHNIHMEDAKLERGSISKSTTTEKPIDIGFFASIEFRMHNKVNDIECNVVVKAAATQTVCIEHKAFRWFRKMSTIPTEKLSIAVSTAQLRIESELCYRDANNLNRLLCIQTLILNHNWNILLHTGTKGSSNKHF